mmetsp:Transcript_3401/g.10513  ORF Transcript_3401/g.10513 Transcript_3401/m.10513 type:complete len:251 (-) Transcript_3401:147-899(-)
MRATAARSQRSCKTELEDSRTANSERRTSISFDHRRIAKCVRVAPWRTELSTHIARRRAARRGLLAEIDDPAGPLVVRILEEDEPVEERGQDDPNADKVAETLQRGIRESEHAEQDHEAHTTSCSVHETEVLSDDLGGERQVGFEDEQDEGKHEDVEGDHSRRDVAAALLEFQRSEQGEEKTRDDVGTAHDCDLPREFTAGDVHGRFARAGRSGSAPGKRVVARRRLRHRVRQPRGLHLLLRRLRWLRQP